MRHRHAACSVQAVRSRHQDSGLLPLARDAQRHGHHEIACQALLQEAERLFHSGQFDDGQRVCRSALRLAGRVSLPAWRATGWFIQSVGHGMAGRYTRAFSGYVGLLSQPQLCEAMPADRHARVYVFLGDLSGQLQADLAPLHWLDLAFAMLRRRGAQPCGEFWMARTAALMNLHTLSDNRLHWEPRRARWSEARRQQWLGDAAEAVGQGLKTARASRLPPVLQRLHIQDCEVRALRTGSTDALVEGMVQLQAYRVRNPHFNHWCRALLARAALLLDTPDPARAILNPALGSLAADKHHASPDRDLTLLRALAARALGLASEAQALHASCAVGPAAAHAPELPGVRQVLNALKKLSISVSINA